MGKAAPLSRRLGFCTAAVCALVAVCYRLLPVNAATAALLMLLLVLGAATRWGLAEAIFTSVISVLGFNFFFLPPVGAFTIADPENWVALFTFIVTAVTVSKLSSQSKRREAEAVAGRNEIGTLYELSRAMLMDEARDAVRVSLAKTAQILKLSHIAFYELAANQLYGAVDSAFSQAAMIGVAETGEPSEEGDLMIIPVRMGTHVVGSLALKGARLSRTACDSIAGLLAINYERVRALDRTAAAEVARRNEEFKSSLLDGLAHDLKTPLTAIRTCVTRLISIPPRTEEVRQELLTIIDEASERLQQSITEAVELARIDSRELRLNRETTELTELVYTAIQGTRDENCARYIVDMPKDLTLELDPGLIRRVIVQLLENARKYSPPESPIVIEGRIEDGQALISVQDRGTGIAANELDLVFKKFYRGRGSRGTTEGTGMGLAIAKGIVEAHGGRIRAQNRPGGGAEIVFTLPAQASVLRPGFEPVE